MKSRQVRLKEVQRTKQLALNAACQSLPSLNMTTTDTADGRHFQHTCQGVATPIEVPKFIRIKPDIELVSVRDNPIVFFTRLGCYDATTGGINMSELNKIKQYLDMIKDGTAAALLKTLAIWNFGNRYQHIIYPQTLDAIKEYFNRHFELDGKCHKIFWPRRGNFPGYVDDTEVASHDCGFKPDLSQIKSPSDKIDPLAHGEINPDLDVLFPNAGTTISWDSATLEALGYPPGCTITATNSGTNVKPNWQIEVTCYNTARDLKVKVTHNGIFKIEANAQLTQFKIGNIKDFDDMNRGNAFKKFMQNESDTKNVNNLLLLLGLTCIKSYGDNSFDMVQRFLQLLGQPTTIYTCDFTLELSAKTAGNESGVVLTTNHRENQGGPTGNLSTRFSPIELSQLQEIESLYASCKFENKSYLDLFINLYNQHKGTGNIVVKLGSEPKQVGLWFLATLIQSLQDMMTAHENIVERFKQYQQVQGPDKEKILQLLKSYCTIVVPLEYKNGAWTVLTRTELVSKLPTDVGNLNQLVQSCSPLYDANKSMLNTKMKDCLRTNGFDPNRIGKANMRDYANFISTNLKSPASLPEFTVSDASTDVKIVEGADAADAAAAAAAKVVVEGADAGMAEAQGGGRNRKRDSLKIGGMEGKKRDSAGVVSDIAPLYRRRQLIGHAIVAHKDRQAAVTAIIAARQAEAAEAAREAAETAAVNIQRVTRGFNVRQAEARKTKRFEIARLLTYSITEDKLNDSLIRPIIQNLIGYTDENLNKDTANTDQTFSMFRPPDAPGNTGMELEVCFTTLSLIYLSDVLSIILKLLWVRFTTLCALSDLSEEPVEAATLDEARHIEDAFKQRCHAALKEFSELNQLYGQHEHLHQIEQLISGLGQSIDVPVVSSELYEQIEELHTYISMFLERCNVVNSTLSLEAVNSRLYLDCFNRCREYYIENGHPVNLVAIQLTCDEILHIACNVFWSSSFIVYRGMSDEMFEEFVHHYIDELQFIQQQQPQQQQQFIDIPTATYKSIGVDSTREILKKFIAFYIGKNPKFKEYDDKAKTEQISALYSQLDANSTSKSGLNLVLMALYDVFNIPDSNDTTSTVSDDELNRGLIPYLYCYYSSESEITSWEQLQECYERIKPQIQSSSTSSTSSSLTSDSGDWASLSPKTVLKSKGGYAERYAAITGIGMDSGGGSSTRRRRNLHRNRCRTQYTDKHKRMSSSNSKKRSSIKHRKSHMKHMHTIKRRKSRRNNRG